MSKLLQNKFALSQEGARNLIKAIILSSILNISFMLPVMFGFQFIDQSLKLMSGDSMASLSSLGYYGGFSVLSLVIMFVIAYFQYDSTYTRIYEESAKSRINLAETLRKLPLAFFGKKDIADLSATIMEDATQIEQLFSHVVPQIFAAGISILLMAIMMFVYNWQMSLAVFWVVPVAFLVFFSSKKLQNKAHLEVYQIKRGISDTVQEMLDSVHEIRSYNRERDFSNKLNDELTGYERYLIKTELVLGALINFAYVVLKLGLPTVMITGGYLLSQGGIDVFTYIVFLVVTARIYNPIMEIMDNLAALLYLNVRIKRMKEMEAMPRQEGRTEFEPDFFDIEFKNVDFSYIEGVQTLKDVSFTAKQGQVTALVGPSGGGKSTVAKLSARFWDIDSGCITLGGQDISKIDPETLLGYYSIVFQDVTLFNSSVMENIRLGRKDASDEEVRQAAKLARCDDFIKKLPSGYDTLIGENGARLSGGERQRISIARAMLKDAPIILLDEATASLDAENETKIQAALSELIKDKTVLIIAHRMRTVSGADKVVVIKNGSIEEMGLPSNLKDGIFSSMLETQYQVG
ncbi:ABC transporter ATP-binding protein [Acidaminobacter sp. JC074]|uniref:ABC transporter ATP-binding protein n=1 Tax=Acidaminobacter sp. JC074 TaxID=2530199 RepID=UPI001F0FD430|nr:ABC transporter ATP-binding protein [Acidaminobacter sp. JC074]MCH4889072.1 ABC transporter ATP-binding protein [Acidaminobacter sp. JC074]